MNKNNNTYVIIYAAVMVVLVAVGLALASSALKERQTDNENIDQMRQILRSLKMDVTGEDAMKTYFEVVTNSYLVDKNGEVVPGSEGTGVTAPAFAYNLSELKNSDNFPVYEATVDGAKKYVLGMRGQGLWGPIWGYMALNDDGNTVYGVDFSHEGETPGLGAEIVTPAFRGQFEGKEFYKDGAFKSIGVVKKGQTDASRDYVDGISGGTLTSNGVQAMLSQSIGAYDPFLQKLQSGKE